MAYTKPVVTIELAEYQALLEKKALKGTELTAEEYELVATELISIAITRPELITRPPKEGVIVQTPIGRFKAVLTLVAVIGSKLPVQSLKFSRVE